MRHLYVAATLMELGAVFDQVPADWECGRVWVDGLDGFLYTGVGILPTGLSLAQALIEFAPMAIIDLGICGVYAGVQAQIGDVVWIHQEHLADFGVSDGKCFLGASELGWRTPSQFQLENPFQLQTWTKAQKGALEALKGPFCGATVQRCTGSDQEAQMWISRGYEVETMEGAAVAACAQRFGIQVVQIRAISNVAGPRDLSTWRISWALEQLRKVLNVQTEA